MFYDKLIGYPIICFRKQGIIDKATIILFLGALLISAIVLIETVHQPILEMHKFRQTQTAITSFWFTQDGFRLAYETPVLGAPWAIPFEFPIYQALVSVISLAFPSAMTEVGRTVSYIFFLATLIPAWLICKKLKLERRVFFIFGALYLVSPQYLFWGRTFMIESAALFFTISFIASALPLVMNTQVGMPSILLVIITGSFAILQKSTTALPPIIFIGVFIIYIAISNNEIKRHGGLFNIVFRGLVLLIPLVIGFIWVNLSDEIKFGNEFGKYLTSSSLTAWNVGSIEQRFSQEIWRMVIWERAMQNNSAGLLGIAILGYSIIKAGDKKNVLLVILGLLLFLFPILAFSNLYIVHYYYPTANIIYLIFSLSVAIGLIARAETAGIYILILSLCFLSNFMSFLDDDWKIARVEITEYNDQTLAIAKFIKARTSSSDYILVYGRDWSSELPFYSQRRGLAVPFWAKSYDDPLYSPEKFLGAEPSALVICDSTEKMPSKDALRAFLDKRPHFIRTQIGTCQVFYPGQRQMP